jgi:chromosome segregation protein
VRDARLRLIADDLVQLTATLEQEVADETALIARRTEVETALASLGARLTALEVEADETRPQLAAAQQRWFALTRLVERFTSTATLAGERVRLLAEDEADNAGPASGPAIPRDPDALRAQAAALRTEHEELLAEIAAATAALTAAVTARTESERRYAAEQQRLAALVRAAADRREGLAKLAGQVAAKASRVEAGEAEVGRLQAGVGQILARSLEAEREFARLEASIAVDEEGEEGLDAAYEKANAELTALQAEQERLREQERTADRDRQSATARAEALALSLTRRDGAATLLGSDGNPREGVLGAVSSLIEVVDGHEAAIAAALGWAADAVAVASIDAAVAGVAALRAAESGRAGMLVGATARPGASGAGPRCRPGRGGPPMSSARRMPLRRPCTNCSTGWPWSPMSQPPERSSPRGSLRSLPTATSMRPASSSVVTAARRACWRWSPRWRRLAPLLPPPDAWSSRPSSRWRACGIASPTCRSGSRPAWSGCTSPMPG